MTFGSIFNERLTRLTADDYDLGQRCEQTIRTEGHVSIYRKAMANTNPSS